MEWEEKLKKTLRKYGDSSIRTTELHKELFELILDVQNRSICHGMELATHLTSRMIDSVDRTYCRLPQLDFSQPN